MTTRVKYFLDTLLLFTTLVFILSACAGGESASADTQAPQDLVISSGEATAESEDEEAAKDAEDTQASEDDDWEGEEAGDLMDLTGTWTSDPTDGSWVEAVIDDDADTITIRCLSDDGDTSSTYWIGSYDPPEDESEPYRWESVREEASDAKMSSTDDTMEISYSEDALHFELTQNGEKESVELICG